MDMSGLVKEMVAFLVPFLPYRLKAGEKAAEKTGEKMSEGAWEAAKALWAKLRPKVEVQFPKRLGSMITDITMFRTIVLI